MGSACVVTAVSDKGRAGRCPGDHDISRQALRREDAGLADPPTPNLCTRCFRMRWCCGLKLTDARVQIFFVPALRQTHTNLLFGISEYLKRHFDFDSASKPVQSRELYSRQWYEKCSLGWQLQAPSNSLSCFVLLLLLFILICRRCAVSLIIWQLSETKGGGWAEISSCVSASQNPPVTNPLFKLAASIKTLFFFLTCHGMLSVCMTDNEMRLLIIITLFHPPPPSCSANK